MEVGLNDTSCHNNKLAPPTTTHPDLRREITRGAWSFSETGNRLVHRFAGSTM